MDNLYSKSIKFFTGQASDEEIAELTAYVDADNARLKEIDKAFKLYLVSEVAAHDPSVRQRISSRRQTNTRRRTACFIALATAASLAIGIVFTHLLDRKSTDNLIQSSTLVSEAKPGQQARVTLPDGTVVELNSGSRLEYPAIFGKENREVRLNGEALFDVAHDAKHPFVVKTFAYDVKVLGTQFDVLAYESTKEFSASLISGSIELLTPTGKSALVLSPGQTATLNQGQLKLEAYNPAEDMWATGVLYATGSTFEELMHEMERCYGVRIIIDKRPIPELKYSQLKVRISNGVEYALKALQRTTDFDYTYDPINNIYHII